MHKMLFHGVQDPAACSG